MTSIIFSTDTSIWHSASDLSAGKNSFDVGPFLTCSVVSSEAMNWCTISAIALSPCLFLLYLDHPLALQVDWQSSYSCSSASAMFEKDLCSYLIAIVQHHFSIKSLSQIICSPLQVRFKEFIIKKPYISFCFSKQK